MTSELQLDLDAICQELLAGDASARERLIVAALPIIATCVDRLQSLHSDAKQQEADDLQSEAVLAVTGFVNGLSPPAPANVGAALYRVAERAIIDFAINNNLVGPCARTVQDRREEIEEIEAIPEDERTDEHRKILAVGDGLGRTFALEDHDFKGKPQPASAVELLDELLSLCNTERERRIVELRAQGKCDSDIAAVLGCSDETVRLTRRTFEQRVKPYVEFLVGRQRATKPPTMTRSNRPKSQRVESDLSLSLSA